MWRPPAKATPTFLMPEPLRRAATGKTKSGEVDAKTAKVATHDPTAVPYHRRIRHFPSRLERTRCQGPGPRGGSRRSFDVRSRHEQRSKKAMAGIGLSLPKVMQQRCDLKKKNGPPAIRWREGHYRRRHHERPKLVEKQPRQ